MLIAKNKTKKKKHSDSLGKKKKINIFTFTGVISPDAIATVAAFFVTMGKDSHTHTL